MSRNYGYRRSGWHTFWTSVLITVFLGVFVFAGYKLFGILKDYHDGRAEYERLQQYAVPIRSADLSSLIYHEEETTTPAVISNDSKPEEEITPEEKELTRDLELMDFTELQRINPEIKAWLTIIGTNINYPVVQTTDDEKYLHTTFEGNGNNAGCLFFSHHNHVVDDVNNVIYGHNMKNGTMFRDLIQYKDEQFRKAHRYGLLYTPEKTYALELLAAYVVQADGGYDQVLFSSQEEEEAFFYWIKDRAAKAGQKIDMNCRQALPLLTLSTCTYEYNNARYAVHFRIIG